ncbi:pallilysin-related adhesin [Borrelia puertoricensis]|uniref:pallilysin-related adhesin n=1 Tax=Borrelia puertoricensis TaxID=2756107 RepID=UPI001FF442E4|nr:pallilysin-related adhesin [Borrelia puertoricensis]UPA17575.1 pallilysin-related adhesin [Borrelia puertoricensis]
MCFKKWIIFLFVTLFSCVEGSKDFIIFNKEMKKISEISYSDTDLSGDTGEDFFGSLIDLKGYKILSVHQENLNLDVYFEQVVLAQNFADLKTYLFIIGFDPKNHEAVVLFKTQVNIDSKSSYNIYLEDITGDYNFDIVIQGFLDEDSVLYVFQRAVANDVASYRPIFFDKVNGSIIINKYDRSSAYDDKKSRESYSISLERYEKQGEDMIVSKIEKYEYSQLQGKYYPLSASEKVRRIDNDVYKTLKNLPKEEVYKFLYGVWYDSNAHQRLRKSNFEDALFLSFNRHLNEISIFKNNSQEIAHIEYISRPAYNTLNISTKSIFSDLIVYNFWIKIIDIDNIEIKIDTGTDAYDKYGFSGVFKRFNDSVLVEDDKNSLFIPSGNYVWKDIIYDFSYPNLTYIVGDNIYYGIFNVFSLDSNLVLEYEISMDENKISEAFIIEYSERIVQKQKFSTILLNPIKILKDEVSLVKGQKLKLERIEKLG